MFSPKCFVFSADAWAGLTKSVATFKAGDIKDCAIKCNILKAECGLIQYNDQTKDCSTAKVALGYYVMHCPCPPSLSRSTVSGMCTR